jgi:hypothetical protein
VNQIAVEIMEEHPLLVGRVEYGQSTRMSSKNPNLIGAKSVADLVRTVHVGISGRIGRGIEAEMAKNVPAAGRRVRTFLDTLVAGFDDLQAIVDGDIDPIDLREPGSENRSMIGSATMLRALAGVYHDLTDREGKDGMAPMARSEVISYFRTLAPRMREIPIAEDNAFWLSTEAFIPGTTAPQARQGSMNSLVRALVKDARAYRASSPDEAGEDPSIEMQEARIA